MEKVCVLGLGYIGLPTAAIFATHGLRVVGVDVDEGVLRSLEAGNLKFPEPGLSALVQTALGSGNLRLARRPEVADTFVIAVPTPLSRRTGAAEGQVQAPAADLSYVVSAAESIVPYLRPRNLVVLESTVPPGTIANVLVPILERSGLPVSGRAVPSQESPIYVAHCPERVLPGRILCEIVHNDRVIGGVDTASSEMARELYATFVKGEILLTDATTAELVKLMENAYRDVNIALANEFALVAESVGVDVWEAIALANRHPRVSILSPGPGVGGHCIAVDPWFIVEAAPQVTRLIRAAREVNDSMPAHVVAMVKKAMVGRTGAVVGCLGLAYKANVGDLRESPALKVVELLRREGFEVRAFDPYVWPSAALDGLLRPTLDETVDEADCVVILTDHKDFRSLTLSQLGPRPVAIVDARNVLSDCRGSSRYVALGCSKSRHDRCS